MKPRVLAAVAAAFLCAAAPRAVFAEQVKVGLLKYQNVKGEIAFSGGAFTACYESGGAFLPAAEIPVKGAFSAASVLETEACADLGETFHTYQEAAQFAKSYPLPYGAYAAPCLTESGAFTVCAAGSAGFSSAQSGPYVLIRDADNAPLLFFSAQAAIKAENVKIGGASYRGVFEFKKSANAVSLINTLDINEYLYSVVPSEMPPSWHEEALKTQAVVSRTRARAKMSTHIALGFNFCDGEHCQAYNGQSAETASAAAAVVQTGNLMIYSGGEVIDAVFSSSSGGHTADSEIVWHEAASYLRGVPDTYETGAKVWQRAFSYDDLTQLGAGNGYNIGRATDARIASRAATGHVTLLEIIGENGVIALEKEEIKSFFAAKGGSLPSRMFATSPDGFAAEAGTGIGAGGKLFRAVGLYAAGEVDLKSAFLISANGASQNKQSTVFFTGASGVVSESLQNAAQGPVSPGQTPAGGVVFYGRGFGHGVGMSQYGAQGMAEAGFSFTDIIKHYYTGVEVY